jgi:uncharacterized membrane protein YhaH (DUF805 family)
MRYNALSQKARRNITQNRECEMIKLLKFFFSTKGRTNRLKYHLSVTIPMSFINIILASESGNEKMIFVLGYFFILPLSVIQIIKRFHDLGKPGWYFFLLLIPFYNIYLCIRLFFIRGDIGPNKYGQDPLPASQEEWKCPECGTINLGSDAKCQCGFIDNR